MLKYLFCLGEPTIAVHNLACQRPHVRFQGPEVGSVDTMFIQTGLSGFDELEGFGNLGLSSENFGLGGLGICL